MPLLTTNDITFSKLVATEARLCWLCQDRISLGDEYVSWEARGHNLEYRTHRYCLFEFFGNFCIFAGTNNVVISEPVTPQYVT